MRRRRFLALLAAAPAASAARPAVYHAASFPNPTPRVAPPEGMRTPFGWTALPVREAITLRFSGAGRRLRIANALDSREPKRVEARTARSGAAIGVFDMRFSYLLQVFELPLDRSLARRAAAEGVTLRLVEGEQPAWIFTAGAPAALRPHLMEPGRDKPIDEFHRRLRGLESVQPFGWMEGCVLDALAALRATDAINQHLDLFLPGGRLVYEDPRSRPADGRAASIEDTLPFAHIARYRPGHAALNLAVSYWTAHRDAAGCVIDGKTTSTEGTYTVAYPMAVIARARRDRDLEALAVRQLRLRRDRLSAPDAVHLRFTEGRGHTYRNWSRGVAWYMLGLSHTLEALEGRDDLRDLRDEFARVAEWALRLQPGSGLWPCFVDDPASGPETSGSAGIAAAIARGAGSGMLPASMRPAARRTLKALEGQLTPDGFLGGVAQSNRGGEALQRGGYRVISQMAMGLMGQLIAAV